MIQQSVRNFKLKFARFAMKSVENYPSEIVT